MKELTTDLWSILLPPEWIAEQNDETIIIVDELEASIIEITVVVPEGDKQQFIQQHVGAQSERVLLADIEASYYCFEEDDMFWREWMCDADDFLLMISHGTDSSNRHMDDSAIDEILATLVLLPETT